MGSAWLLLRAGLRGRWVGTILLVALVGLAAGVCLAAWAGARRTESAYPRLLEEINAEDVTVFYDTPVPPEELEALNAAPGVRQAASGQGYAAAPVDET